MIKRNVIDLRNGELKNLSNNQPGWYRFWGDDSVVTSLLGEYKKSLLSDLTSKNIDGKTFYYLYVGVAIKESVKNRLNWHINQHHSQSAVRSGYLSTLRQSISSLIANQYAEDDTNKILDKMVIEYQTIGFPIKSNEANVKISEIEQSEMDKNNLPLNIQKNKSVICKDFKRYLKRKRKEGKK